MSKSAVRMNAVNINFPVDCLKFIYNYQTYNNKFKIAQAVRRMLGVVQLGQWTKLFPRQSTAQQQLNGNKLRKMKQHTRLKDTSRSTLYRKWLPQQAGSTDAEYNLLSYNILAQDLLVEHLQLYISVDPRDLQWDRRLERLNQQIQRVQPDILCLQEVQFNHLRRLVRALGAGQQLEYVYKKKTGLRTDGCAIIYDSQKFKLLAEQPIEYYVSGHQSLNRNNVALLAKFCARADPHKQFVVANTHLLYNPRREDVRVAQVQHLLNALNVFALDNAKHLPVLLAGDFNCAKDSPAYQLLTSRTDAIPAKSAGLHMLPLTFGQDSVTTWQNCWTQVDHVLHSEASPHSRHIVRVSSVLELPTRHQVNNMWKMPNRVHGSDHFLLAIRFSIV